MSQLIATAYDNPSNLGEMILMGMEEIIGKSQLQSIMNTNNMDSDQSRQAGNEHQRKFSILDLSKFQISLERVFGSVAGRGLAIRSGRASFQYILRKFGGELGLSGNDFKLLAPARRFHVGLVALAGLINRDLGDCIQLETDGEDVLWKIDYSNLPAFRIQRSICHIIVGLLQEALYWFSGGKLYPIQEICCSEQGNSACILRIQMLPII